MVIYLSGLLQDLSDAEADFSFLAGARASALTSTLSFWHNMQEKDSGKEDAEGVATAADRCFVFFILVVRWSFTFLASTSSSPGQWSSRLLALLFTFCAAAKGQVERTTRRLLLSSIVNQERRVPVT